MYWLKPYHVIMEKFYFLPGNVAKRQVTFDSPVNNKSTELHSKMSKKREKRDYKGEIEPGRTENLIKKRTPLQRRKATKQAVKILRDLCIEKEIAAGFENLTSSFIGCTVTKR